ncbi:MAG: hypothetical protein ABH859_05660 [Pseudomonadota bacterium]
MIDTVVITFDKDQFEILEPDIFSPSARMMEVSPNRIGRNGCIRCFQNPSKEDLARGIYRPRFTLTKRLTRGGYTQNLRAEFSLPKLFFGNNFEEDGLKNTTGHNAFFANEALATGIKILPFQVTSAKLSAIHYSKNFIFTDFTTSSMILRQLSRLNLNSRLDLNKTDYRNGGHALRYHANSYEIVFYDKVKDLKQSRISERRAIESDNLIQADLLSNLPKPFEVLRMEVRLNSRAKIKRLCHKLGIKPPLTFEEALNRKTSQTILLHFWNQIMSEAKWLQFEKQRPEDLLQAILKANPDIRPSKALQILGAISVASSVGTRGLKAILGDKTSRTLDRLKFKAIKVGMSCPKSLYFTGIYEQLIDFKPLRLPINIKNRGGNNKCNMQ